MDAFIPGIKVTDREQIQYLKQRVRELVGNHGPSPNDYFPGAQVVSLDRSNMNLFCTIPYKVTWKADGVRYMMLILGEAGVFLVDRKFEFYNVSPVWFPRNVANAKTNTPLVSIDHTLIDGEMCLDEDAPGVLTPRFYVFDLMAFNGRLYAGCPLSTRLEQIRELITRRKNIRVPPGLRARYGNEPFAIRAKNFYSLAETGNVLHKLAPNLAHEMDGLVFTPEPVPYKRGQTDELLKWKPAELNTIDFLAVAKRRAFGKSTKDTFDPSSVSSEADINLQDVSMFLMVGDRGEMVKWDETTLDSLAEYAKWHNTIVECAYDPTKARWVPLRDRPDKNHPNSFRTAESVKKSILDGITESVLLSGIKAALGYLGKTPREVRKGSWKRFMQGSSGSVLPLATAEFPSALPAAPVQPSLPSHEGAGNYIPVDNHRPAGASPTAFFPDAPVYVRKAPA